MRLFFARQPIFPVKDAVVNHKSNQAGQNISDSLRPNDAVITNPRTALRQGERR